jgi:phosphoribosylformylglycinamidine synthase
MKFKANIDIMTREEILDPQGKVVTTSLHHLGMETISNVRIGKHIQFELEADNQQNAETIVEESCQKLLANLIMESYTYRVDEVK